MPTAHKLAFDPKDRRAAGLTRAAGTARFP